MAFKTRRFAAVAVLPLARLFTLGCALRFAIARALALAFITTIWAAVPSTAAARTPQALPQTPPLIAAPHWILQHWHSDAATVTASTLAAHAAQQPTHPASVTKLLTAYVVMTAVARGETTLDAVLTVSDAAVRQEGTRVGYHQGEHVAVRDALQGMLAISGNDAAWALAQHIGAGDEKAFVSRMNATSSGLGLSQNHSQWHNPHGLTQDGHVSTAADLAAIAHALWRDFPLVRPWLGVKSYTWHGVTQSNRNGLLWRDPSVDGLKTGHTDAAGYNLAASSVWQVFAGTDAYDWRLTSVVLGAASKAQRTTDSAALLAWGRSAFLPWRLYAAGESVGKVAVTGADGMHIALAPAAVWQVLPVHQHPSALRYELLPTVNVSAPVAAGAVIGQLQLYDGAQLLATTPAISAQAIARSPWYQRVYLGLHRHIGRWLKSWFA